MQCPVCRHRSAKRACPALGREICPVCCGTKRLTEIACPSTCGYLAASQAHPAAIVRRQQQHDLVFLTALMKGLSGAQKDIAWAVLGFVARYNADPLLRLTDEDAADMAAALSSTLDTAARGLIYEHRPSSLAAQRLLTEVKTFLDQGREQAPAAGFDRDAAAALRRVSETFREGRKLLDDQAADACLAVIDRAARSAAATAQAEDQGPIARSGPSLIVP